MLSRTIYRECAAQGVSVHTEDARRRVGQLVAAGVLLANQSLTPTQVAQGLIACAHLRTVAATAQEVSHLGLMTEHARGTTLLATLAEILASPDKAAGVHAVEISTRGARIVLEDHELKFGDATPFGRMTRIPGKLVQVLALNLEAERALSEQTPVADARHANNAFA